MRTYKHLTSADREAISRKLAAGASLRSIAKDLDRNVSTISREIDQKPPDDYRAVEAEKRSEKKRRVARRRHILEMDVWLWNFVRGKLRLAWSPEQIADRLKRIYPDDVSKRVSHETIYAHLYALPRGTLRKELIGFLRKSHRHRRKRRYIHDRRGQIPNLVSIDERPKSVDTREVPGDWEGDLLVGKYNRSAIGTLVERTTRKTLLCKVRGRTTAEVTAAFEKRLMQLPSFLRTSITYDRGKEMSDHVSFTQRTKIKVYFCDPYSPWQRGTNENTNGLLRQFFPKGTDLNDITDQEISRVETLLNGRPRKVLQFQTPDEAFTSYLSVALKS
jgi:transposase, IS30 family